MREKEGGGKGVKRSDNWTRPDISKTRRGIFEAVVSEKVVARRKRGKRKEADRRGDRPAVRRKKKKSKRKLL